MATLESIQLLGSPWLLAPPTGVTTQVSFRDHGDLPALVGSFFQPGHEGGLVR